MDEAGDILVIGAPGVEDGRGAVFFYYFDIIEEDWRLFDWIRGFGGGSRFGASVSLDLAGRWLVVGAPGDDGGGVDRTIEVRNE